jgi:general stress protein YciG
MATSKSTKKDNQSQDKQGFAAMDEDKRKAAASKGGRSSGKSDKADQEEDSIEAGGDGDQELDELMSLIESEELLNLDPEEAVEMIDEWHEILNKSGDADLKEIGKSLKQLKKVLSASKSKPADISEALIGLGEQVNEYADDAQRGYKTKLHNLGKALSRAGKSIEEPDAEDEE